MRFYFLTCCLLFGGLFQDLGLAQPQPNIVVILTDDMGYSDLPVFGESEIPTPNIDRLAEEGIKLTNAYVCAPICVPSRMGLMTGRYQQRYGVYDNVYTAEENRLWVKEITLANVLQDHGYRTANIGKWHLSGNKWPWVLPPPHERGFDEFVGIEGGMDDFWKGTTLVRYQEEEYQIFESPDYLTDFFGQEAEAFIERNRENPFFLYLAFNAPHAPLHGLEEDQAAIAADWVSAERRIYGAMVVAVDRNVGRVLDALAKHDLEENTLLIFLNDNGGGGNNAMWHTRNTARNLPNRGHKYDVQEGGVHVPMIVRWPGKVEAGTTFNGLSSSLDIFPTALAAAGVPHPQQRVCDGVDLLPYLKGESQGDPHQYLYWQQLYIDRRRPNRRPPPQQHDLYTFAVRNGIWKAIKQDQAVKGSDNRPWELYDLSRDPSELQDVASEFPEITERLASQFQQWQEQMHPPLEAPKKK